MNPEDQIKKIIKVINQSIDSSISKQNMDSYSKNAARDVKARTRSGKGVNNLGGNELQLKPLKLTTIEVRKGLQKAGNLNFNTTPTKSNVTRSGQLTDGILGISPGKAKGKIFLRDNRARHIDNKSNHDVATELEMGGRKFFNLSRNEVLSIVKDYSLTLKTELTKLLKNAFR